MTVVAYTWTDPKVAAGLAAQGLEATEEDGKIVVAAKAAPRPRARAAAK